MFIQINSRRIKVALIHEYNVDGKNSLNIWYLTIKISGKERKFSFNSEEELNKVVKRLDKILKVESI